MRTEAFEVIVLNDYASLTGGSTSVAIASARGLAALGVRVTFFACVGPVAAALQDVPNLEVVCLGQEEIAKNRNRAQASLSGWCNDRAVRALRALLSHKSPATTVVHVHTWTKALSPFALDTVTRLGFPLVVTLHDFFIACPNGGFFVHRTKEICRRVPLSSSCWRCSCDRRNYRHKLWRNFRTVLQNRLLRVPEKVSVFIGVSAFSLNLLRRYLPEPTPTRIVRNPIDSPLEPRVRVTENRDFLFIGRFEAEKGVELFAEAVRLSGVPATFIGDGALAPRIRQLCPEANFTGWLGATEIRDHIRRARALVFPSLWYETLGLVVIEAAAMGVPAIVASGCAATDHIRDGVNGLHFTHGSAESLGRQMAVIARNDGLANHLSQAAHEWYWRDPWTTAHHVSALLEIYRELVGAPPAAAALPGRKVA